MLTIEHGLSSYVITPYVIAIDTGERYEIGPITYSNIAKSYMYLCLLGRYGRFDLVYNYLVYCKWPKLAVPLLVVYTKVATVYQFYIPLYQLEKRALLFA